MDFLIILLCTILGCFIFRKFLKKMPWIFYGIALVLDLIFITGAFSALPKPVWSVLYLMVQKCMLPLALFVVVMFIGVFPMSSKIRQILQPIRSELSVLACLLCLGHIVVYLMSYVSRVISGALASVNILISLIVAFVLLVLLVILGVTSFKCVKRTMKTSDWKKIQKLAYPFFGLVYVHLLVMLLPSALHGGSVAMASVVVYTVIFALYVVLRIWRALLDKKAENQIANEGV